MNETIVQCIFNVVNATLHLPVDHRETILKHLDELCVEIKKAQND
jgi:hypothetical protein